MQLEQIETAETKKQNIQPALTALNASLTQLESDIEKPMAAGPEHTDIEGPLKQAWQEACANEATALKAVEEAEQEQNDLALPEA